ncbi:allergen Fel d 4-like [Hipposideros larvatus]
MKLLLLCLGLTLVWAHEEGHGEVVTSNFDLSKISGEWYSVLLASDEMEKIDENGSLRIFNHSTSMNLNDHTRDTTVTVNLPTAREPDVSEELKTRFQEVCQEYGIPKENILDLTEVDRCLQTRGSD